MHNGCEYDDVGSKDMAAVPTTLPSNGATTRKPFPIIDAKGVTVARQNEAFRTRGTSSAQASPNAIAGNAQLIIEVDI